MTVIGQPELLAAALAAAGHVGQMPDHLPPALDHLTHVHHGDAAAHGAAAAAAADEEEAAAMVAAAAGAAAGGRSAEELLGLGFHGEGGEGGDLSALAGMGGEDPAAKRARVG